MTISVIIPIYNAEKTLKKCIDSVLAQTENVQIILIDDGSTDLSPQICDEYAFQNSNVKVIHKQNEGMGKAYNLGISVADGDYIGLVESDDWIESNMYEMLYKSAVQYNSDIVKCGLYYNNQGQDLYPILEQNILNDIDQTKQPFCILDNKNLLFYHSSVWATLYKSDFIKNIKFSEEPDASYQDFSFTMEALIKAKRISVVNQFLYHWNISNDNASIKRADKRLMRILDQAILAKQILQRENMFESLFSEFYKQMIISNYNFYNAISLEYKEVFYNRLNTFFNDININNLYNVVKYFTESEIRFLLYILSGNYNPSKNIYY